MEKILLETGLRKKGLYYYLTKSSTLTCLGTCILTLIIDGMHHSWSRIPFDRYLSVLGIIIAIFLLCQIVFARLFPHRVTVLNDRIRFVGPWKMGEQILKFKNIQSIDYNDEVLLIRPRWPGITKVYITRSLDPDRQIQEVLLGTLKGHSHIELREGVKI